MKVIVLTLKYIFQTDEEYVVRKMPTWKCTDTEVSMEKAQESLDAIKSACFGCSTHNNDCPIAHAAGAVAAMIKE
ncbi:MAG: hypothetical protein V1862_14230 [Methanobacteriota archaeon]